MVDIQLPYGGTMAWSLQGTPVLVSDQPGSPLATKQQVEALVMTSPRPKDVDGTAIGRPDNLFYPDRGGGLAAIVGARPVPQYLNNMQARILAALSTKPGVAATPAPSVSVSDSGPTLTVAVAVYTITGDVINVSTQSGG